MKTQTLKIMILGMGLILSACAKEKVTNIDNDFAPFVARFEKVSAQVGANVKVNNLTVSFDDSLNGTHTLGVCRFRGDLIVPEIRINRQFWKNTSMISREQLMFHEMGHCVLSRPHNASEYIGYYPLSIMSPYFFGDSLYTVNYNAYVNELFLNKTPSVIYASGVSQFPAGAYASTASTSYASSQKVQEYSVSVESLPENGLSDEDYKNIENFGCGEQ